MDSVSYLDWISQADVCRCCLSASGVFDLTAVYITDTGTKEVFADILLRCFGITLSNEFSTSNLICESCVSQLRSASNFQKQVVDSEGIFIDYWKTNKDSMKKENGTINTNNINKNTTRRSSQEYDSDTPISEIKHSINGNAFEDFNLEGYNLDCELKENVLNTCRGKVQNSKEQAIDKLKKVKYVSERKRIIQTCDTVLRETTACPFRHHKSWFQCFYCRQDFMEIEKLRNHIMKSHSDIDDEIKKIKRYPRSLQIDISDLHCRKCQLNLTDVTTMTHHLVERHNKVIYREYIADYKVNSSPYTCHLCNREFHVFRTLTTHLNEHYANCICDVCGKSFLNTKRLKVHKRTHESGTYPCSKCDKILKTKSSKANHMESAHSKRVIKCQLCCEPMKNYNDRIKHMSDVHNITHTFKCPICSRVYNIKHYLATHIRQTHGHKNKKCTVCGMAFITNHGLKKHMSKHTGERPFSCTMCCKSYARSYTLREHMRSHENEKNAPT